MSNVKRPRGRPRDPGIDRSILRAARAVFAERGFTGATMEEIAGKARVGKDTLYRRWPSKERLAIDLVDTLAREAVRPAPVDPDPRLNLFLYVKDIVRLNEGSDFGPLVAGLVGEAARSGDLAESLQAFWRHRRSVAATLLIDVVGSPADNADLDLLLDRLLAPIYYRLLLTRQPITDEFLWELVTALPWTTDPTRDGLGSQLEIESVDAPIDGPM
jgi:AcrR family transcriptional regulator